LSSRIEVTADRPAAFAIFLRIPAWAGSGSAVAINGRRVPADLTPGKFARLDGTWKQGDRIEVELHAQTILEAVDPQHPDVVAPLNGPLALFALEELPRRISRESILNAEQVGIGSSTWQAKTESGVLTLKPFPAIEDGIYRLYHPMES